MWIWKMTMLWVDLSVILAFEGIMVLALCLIGATSGHQMLRAVNNGISDFLDEA